MFDLPICDLIRARIFPFMTGGKGINAVYGADSGNRRGQGGNRYGLLRSVDFRAGVWRVFFCRWGSSHFF